MSRRRVWGIGLVLLAVVAVSTATAAPPKDAMVIGLLAEPVTMDPPQVTDLNSTRVIKRLFEGLTAQELGTYKIIPGLAQSWDISKDGLTYTFHLRPNVKFHDGTPLTAEAVKFCFDRQLNDQGPFYATGTYPYVKGFLGNVAGVEVVNPTTVQIRLKSALTPFLQYLAHHSLYIYSPDALKKWGKDIVKHPVGTGPFKLETWEPGVRVVLARNDQYWGGKPKLDKLVFAITPDAAVRWAKLKANECQVMPFPNPADVAAMQKDPSIKVLHQEGLNIGYLAFNTEHKPLDDVRVRQAINYAINRDAILKAVYQGAGKKAKNPIPPTIWSYNDAVKDYAYSPAKAKALLAEAGLKDGFKAKLWAMPVQRPYNPNAKLMAEMMQADLKKVGIDVEIVSYEWGEYLKRSKAGEHDMVLLGWTGDNGDPDNFLNQLLSCGAAKDGGNRARWCDKTFDDAVTQAKMTSDIKKRTALYKAAQVEFKAQAPWVTVAHSLVYEPIRTNVKNYKVDPFGLHVFNDVDLQ